MNHTLPTASATGLLLLCVSVACADGTDSAPPKTHTLFMGVNITATVSGEAAAVRDIRGNVVVIARRGETEEVRAGRRPLELQAKPALKLSDTLASVSGLKSERTYSAKRDPRRKATGMADMTSAQVATDMGSAVLSFGANPQSILADSIAHGTSSASESSYTALSAAAVAGQNAANQAPTATGGVQGAEEETFDALFVTFDITSPEEPLDAAFCVAVVDFHRPQARPGRGETAVAARALPYIHARPYRVDFALEGFPPGYVLDGARIHLFNRGVEVATNVAPMQSQLSEDEAFEYRVIDYIAENKSATLPAAPAAGALTEQVLAHLRSRYASRAVYVRVLITGRASALFTDERCTQPLEDEALMNLLRGVRFNPALSKGRPVRGVAILQAPADRI